jgi:hypothetical protein
MVKKIVVTVMILIEIYLVLLGHNTKDLTGFEMSLFVSIAVILFSLCLNPRDKHSTNMSKEDINNLVKQDQLLRDKIYNSYLEKGIKLSPKEVYEKMRNNDT